jgi:hypothetical protein
VVVLGGFRAQFAVRNVHIPGMILFGRLLSMSATVSMVLIGERFGVACLRDGA